jgi:hypothetical protein
MHTSLEHEHLPVYIKSWAIAVAITDQTTAKDNTVRKEQKQRWPRKPIANLLTRRLDTSFVFAIPTSISVTFHLMRADCSNLIPRARSIPG